MTDWGKTKRDIDTLLESIKLDWNEYAATGRAQERAQIRQHIAWCIKELADLLAQEKPD
jgi:hypothetical protein